jgi:hypothetical protein
MQQSAVWAFFYGSYMNFNVLKEVNLVPRQHAVGKLSGFDIRIQPLANLVVCERSCVYGIVASATHDELSRLYAHAQHVLGGVYVPQAVLVEVKESKWMPALCYLAPCMRPEPARDEYIDRIVAPAKEYGFPAWYIERLENFRPR